MQYFRRFKGKYNQMTMAAPCVNVGGLFALQVYGFKGKSYKAIAGFDSEKLPEQQRVTQASSLEY